MIEFLFIICFLINCFFVWYVYKFLLRYSELISLIDDIRYKIFIFSNHIKQVHELEIFYGDETLQSLIEHSELLLSSFEQFDEDYVVFDGEREQNELQEIAEDKTRS